MSDKIAYSMHALEASRIIMDEYCVKILSATLDEPRTAIDLSRQMNIPIAACYRRIRMLQKNGLLRCKEKKLTVEGKYIAAYESLLKRAHILYENGRVRARLEMVSGEQEELVLECK
ncbi:MAG: helix-turn-helix transcriptional regulator [Methanomassiliicoccales archaeon]|nr:helix-turn-helix transcriptional regulator [Methanomassiliicoccales archaeon]